jgi:hypothetical protein
MACVFLLQFILNEFITVWNSPLFILIDFIDFCLFFYLNDSKRQLLSCIGGPQYSRALLQVVPLLTKVLGCTDTTEGHLV